jgi:hypothetical protein
MEDILNTVESKNLGNAKALAIQRLEMLPYYNMGAFLIVKARGFGAAEIS